MRCSHALITTFVVSSCTLSAPPAHDAPRAPEPSAAIVNPVENAAAVGAPASASAGTGNQAQRARAPAPPPHADVPADQRALYEILVRLATDPSAQAELAPNARWIFHGESTSQKPIKDAQKDLRWVASTGGIRQIAQGAPPPQGEEGYAVCEVDKLRCVFELPEAQQVVFKFRRHGKGDQARIVLQQMETHDT